MKHPAITAALLAATALALSGCGMLFGPEKAPRDEQGAISKETTAAAFTLRVGDCMNEPEDGDIDSVNVVPCADPHEFEIYHSFKLEGTEFPATDEALDELTLPGCDAAFATFIGRDVEDSRLDYFTLTPTENSWNFANDRTIQCVVGDPQNGTTSGSLRGSNL